MESLDLYGDLIRMTPKENEALEWALDALEEVGEIETKHDRAAWKYFLFSTTPKKTYEGFAESVDRAGQTPLPEMMADVLGALALEMERPTCQRIVIGTTGTFFGFVLPDGEEKAFNFNPEGVEPKAAYVFSNLDLQNIAKGPQFGNTSHAGYPSMN
jgi:hypothetical protein